MTQENSMIAPFLDTIQQYDDLPLDQVIHGDSLEVLKRIQSNAVDSIVCDPPAGINFMNKAFDSNRGGRDAWIAWLSSIMKEAMRCLKPGGHAVVWALPRTSHWTATALEDAGFEVRDCISHFYSTDNAIAPFLHSLNDEQRNALEAILESQEPSVISAMFGSGFPKSQDISKAIDARLGAKREKTRSIITPHTTAAKGFSNELDERPWMTIAREKGYHEHAGPIPVTNEAKRFSGYGTALKPSNEHWILCRKPLSEPTIATNVLKWDGCGAINIDKTRVNPGETVPGGGNGKANNGGRFGSGEYSGTRPLSHPHTLGRFPSNTLFSHSAACDDAACAEDCPVRLLDAQSGILKTSSIHGKANPHSANIFGSGSSFDAEWEKTSGGASRYFQRFHPHDDIDDALQSPFYYTSKASRREREQGCEHLPTSQGFDKNTCKQIAHINHETGKTSYSEYSPSERHNTHPTVKSLALCRYLCRLVGVPDGIILDPFCGSGSIPIAAYVEGMHFIGIEQEQEYVTIARARLQHATKEYTRKASLAEHNGK